MKEIRLKNIELGDTGADAKDKINQNDANLRDSILNVDNKYYTLDKQNVKKENLSQTLGSSENLIPSEKAVRDALSQYPTKNEVALGTILKGNKANEAEIKSLPNTRSGDTYRALDTNHYWTFDGKEWNDLGSILPNDAVTQSTICNVSQLNNNYTYPDKQSARNAVPLDKRAKGQIITYEMGKIENSQDITQAVKSYLDLTGRYIQLGDNGLGKPTGRIPVWNTINVQFILMYPLKSYTKYIIEGVAPPNKIPCVFISSNNNINSNIEIQVIEPDDTGKYIYKTDNQDAYLSIHVYLSQNSNDFDCRNSVRITATSSKQMWVTEQYIGEVWNDNEVWNDIGDKEIDIKQFGLIEIPLQVHDDTVLNVQTGIIDNVPITNIYSSSSNIVELEPNCDYVIDYGKKKIGNNYENGNLPNGIGMLFLHEEDPIRSRTPRKVFIANQFTRYIHFSTKGIQKIKYCSFVSFAKDASLGGRTNFDVRSTAKLYKAQNPELLIYNKPYFNRSFGKYGTDISNLNSIRIPMPDWCKVNIIGYNADMTSKVLYLSKYLEYCDSNGYYFKKPVMMAIQGNSSASLYKKNYKVKLLNEDGSKFSLQIGNWYPRSSFHLKANYSDVTQTKNIGFYRWVNSIREKKRYDRKYPNVLYADKVDMRHRFNYTPMFVMDGIPCEGHCCGGFMGNYTFNLNDFSENYGIYSDMKDAFVYNGQSTFEKPDLTACEWEEVKTDTALNPHEGETVWSDNTAQPMKDLTAWIYANRNSTTDFKATFQDHFDLDSMLDYYVMLWVGHAFDNVSNNLVLYTYDRKKFYIGFRDCDTWAGQDWVNDGKKWLPPTSDDTIIIWNSNLWSRFAKAYDSEIKSKYAELRNSGIITVEHLEKILTKIQSGFTYEAYLRDIMSWGGQGTNTENKRGSIMQILSWIDERIKFLDKKFGYQNI